MVVDSAWAWIEVRFKLSKEEDVRPLLKKPVPGHATNSVYCLGGISFLSFLLLVGSGILLARYYVPTPEKAYDTVRFIMLEVPMGSLIRSIHHWSANIMVAAIVLHMLRVFFTGSYKNPRELNWIIGMLLLFTTLVAGFSGYLLPWDQLSFWATTVGLQIPAVIPVIGPAMLKVFIGGAEVTGETLSRFYFLHIFMIPMTLLALMGLHFLIIRRQGISGPL